MLTLHRRISTTDHYLTEDDRPIYGTRKGWLDDENAPLSNVSLFAHGRVNLIQEQSLEPSPSPSLVEDDLALVVAFAGFLLTVFARPKENSQRIHKTDDEYL